LRRLPGTRGQAPPVHQGPRDLAERRALERRARTGQQRPPPPTSRRAPHNLPGLRLPASRQAVGPHREGPVVVTITETDNGTVIEAERNIIGAAFLEPDSLRFAIDHVTPQDFTDVRLGRVYNMLIAMRSLGNP